MRAERLIPGQYYHIYNRGVDRHPIFFTPDNWVFFIRRMRDYFTPDQIELIAYCLMQTHYHLCAHVCGEDVSRSVLQPFTVSYTKAVNK